MLSLILYALTLLITVDDIYGDIVIFAIRRFVFLLIFIITLITYQDLPAVQLLMRDLPKITPFLFLFKNIIYQLYFRLLAHIS